MPARKKAAAAKDSTAAGFVLFFNQVKLKARQGRAFQINIGRIFIFERKVPKTFISEAGFRRIGELIELGKNDYNFSPSRSIHTGAAETWRPIGEIVAELDAIEAEARETDKALRKILKHLGMAS